MKVVVTKGCVCDNVEIDDELFQDMTPDQKRKVLHEFIDKMPIDYGFNLFHEMIPMFGQYKFIGNCEECGDSICEYTFDSDDDMYKD